MAPRIRTGIATITIDIGILSGMGGVTGMALLLPVTYNKGSIIKFLRRQFLHLAAGAAALPAVSHMAMADTYSPPPTR
jgi:hypothetical protein